MWQQIAVYIVVGVAAVYLGRYLYDAVSSVINARNGCGEGCSKCSYAEQPAKKVDSMGSTTPGGVIRLTDIRTIPPRKP